MKPRHAAALALVGWYLMIPPVRGAPGEILEQAPLSEWEFSNQYDSKAECENFVKESNEHIQETLKQCSNGDCAINVTRPIFGRCIAANDPRLKNNTSVKSSNRAPAISN
jgi:hypothetical protein